MSGDVTIQALERLTHMPDSENPAELIAAQRWNDVEFGGGVITNTTIEPIFSGLITGAQGGTGVANTGKTITLGGNLTTSGAHNTTLTTTGTTDIILPTIGTLVTLAGSETLSNKAITVSTIDSSAIGGTTPSTGAFTYLSTSAQSNPGSATSNISIGATTITSPNLLLAFNAQTITMPIISGGIATTPTGIKIVGMDISGSPTVTTPTGLDVSAVSTINSSGPSAASAITTRMSTLAAGGSIATDRGILVNFPVMATTASITNANAIELVAASLTGNAAITNARGINIPNLGATNITNAYGINIAAQSGAATSNNAINITGGAGQGIAISSGSGNAINYNSAFVVDGSGFMRDAGRSRVSSQFNKTNDTLANVSGLTATVLASGVYTFEAVLSTTAGAAGGMKVAISGTATATSITYSGWNYNGTTLNAMSKTTTLGNAVGAATAVTTDVIIKGCIVVNAAGTLTVQMAQNVTDATQSSVLINSTFKVERIS